MQTLMKTNTVIVIDTETDGLPSDGRTRIYEICAQKI